MKKFYLALSVLILSVFLNSKIFSQTQANEKKVNITYTWSRIHSFGSNQVAVWIEDTEGNHVCTLFATKFTAKGGWVKRPISLSEWTAKFNLKNASKEEVDAFTGATPQPGAQNLVWNCKDRSGKAVPAGTYVVRMEANIHDADKMFFKGAIKIGGSDQKTNGTISYSKDSLANGNVLFKDVLVEYK
jgi:hypothetical protein